MAVDAMRETVWGSIAIPRCRSGILRTSSFPTIFRTLYRKCVRVIIDENVLSISPRLGEEVGFQSDFESKEHLVGRRSLEEG